MWGKVLAFLTIQHLAQSGLEIFERGAVELDLCGLSRPVDGAQADTGGNAVDDGLRELYAGLPVLGGDVEC